MLGGAEFLPSTVVILQLNSLDSVAAARKRLMSDLHASLALKTLKFQQP